VQKLEEKMSSNKELKKCIELLKNDPDSWWKHNKEVLVTLLDKHKNELAGVYELVGEFESYLALATIKKKFDTEGYPVTFTRFTQSDIPSLSMKKLWNPLLDPKKAISNSLHMGGTTDAMRHMILTGSNTGGKSTLLKAVIANTVLSQTYGMAFARTMNHTYFDNILASMNINDNTAEGKSLLLSEAIRAKSILDKSEVGKSLVICDELFVGTSSQKAGKGAAKTLSRLGQNPNTLSLFATHHGPAVTDLDNLPPFSNYKMEATRQSDGSLNYTYRSYAT